MISHKNKVIFVHIVKTGGTSIEQMIGEKTDGKETVRVSYKHQFISFFAQKFPEEFDKYFKFTIVRNTWDWLVSFYNWFSLHSKYFNIDFDTFITEIVCKGNIYDNLSIEDPKRRKDIAGFIKKTLQPQHAWITIDDEIAVDFVGKYETLQRDFNKVCKSLNKDPMQLPYCNVPEEKLRENQTYGKYYSNKTKLLVEEKYAKDIELFGFSYKG